MVRVSFLIYYSSLGNCSLRLFGFVGSQMSDFRGLHFHSGLILYCFKIYRLGLYLANNDWIQIFADASDLLYLFAKSYPIYFSENGTASDFLRKSGNLGIV